MPKTYNSLTVANATAGNAILASDQAKVFENSNNYRVPPMCTVRRTTSATGFSSGASVSFSSAAIDTDSMFSAGAPTRITINTPGLYLVTSLVNAQATATLTLVNSVIGLNGASLSENYTPIFNGTSAVATSSVVVPLVATDYLTLAVTFIGGSAYVVSGAATATSSQTRLSATWLGQVS
jgi:hypothetical protein